MDTKTKGILIALICSLGALFLGNVLWPVSPELPTPSSGQFPFFVLLALIESIAFGLGVAFLILGWNKVSDRRVVFLAIAWLIISWWPHDNMHKHNGDDLAGLLVIEYLFHVTLIIAGLIVARDFWKRLTS